MLIAFIILLLAVAGIYWFMHQPQFGKAPAGERLARMKNSPHYKNGAFENISKTPALTEGVSYAQVIRRFLTADKKTVRPAAPFHFSPADIKSLPVQEDVYVWMGHSSYYLQLGGRRILVDPVFSGAASPVRRTTRAFAGADVYTADDMPPLDYLVITHDHWDHLDYKTVVQLKNKVTTVVTGLGNGAHLEHWGYAPQQITELEWGAAYHGEGITFYCETARHFSGRGFKRNGNLWASFVVESAGRRVYIGGDSGYGAHFEQIGNHFGHFDAAILEAGQYNADWKYIHMLPAEVGLAAAALHTRLLIPVHNSKFALATHAWDAPLRELSSAAYGNGITLITPAIGQLIYLDGRSNETKHWWQ